MSFNFVFNTDVPQGLSDARIYSDFPDVEYKLSGWESLKEKGLWLVHALDIAEVTSAFLSRPAQHVVNQREVLSTTLLDPQVVYTTLAGGAGGPIYTRTPGAIGFILDVPAQNILRARPERVMRRSRVSALKFDFYDNIFYCSPAEGIEQKRAAAGEVSRPADVLRNTWGGINEVLVCCKPDVQIYRHKTRKLKVLGIFYASRGLNETLRRQHEVLLKRLQCLNPSLELSML